jgi:hypothetical protein
MKDNIVKVFSIFFLLLHSCSVNDPESDDFITALSKLETVESIVSEQSQGLILKSIFNKDVHYSGKAERWAYKYSSGGIAVDYYYHATANEVAFDSTSTWTLIGEGLIVDQYFDSNVAMKIAEENGGKEFREDNLDYRIEISLVEPMVQDPNVMWFVKYISSKNNKILHLGINNSTKEVDLYY